MSKPNDLSETISNVNRYMKNLKQQKVLANNNPSFSNSYLSFDHSLSQIPSHTKPFNKSKSKITVNRQDSPLHARSSHHSKDKKESMNMSLKIPSKKQIQQNERDNAFNKGNGRLQIKHLSILLSSSLGTAKDQNKKGGHSHTLTYLNQIDSEKYSEAESNISSKIVKIRHSKSPSKEKHTKNYNHTNTFGDEPDRPIFHNRTQVIDRQHFSREEKRYSPNHVENSFLFQEIYRLQEAIKQYKLVLLDMKHRYLEMESKLKQKALNDHYIDVLKDKIDELQDKNHQLYAIVYEQQQKITSYESKFIDKIKSINDLYTQHQQENIILRAQNRTLKEILLITTRQEDNMAKGSNVSQDNIEQETQNSFLRKMALGMDDLMQKWK